MEISIFSKDFELTPAIETHVREKMKNIHKVDDKIMTLRVTIEKNNDKSLPFKLSGFITSPHGDIKKEVKGEDVYHLVNDLEDKLTRLCRKQKEKQGKH